MATIGAQRNSHRPSRRVATALALANWPTYTSSDPMPLNCLKISKIDDKKRYTDKLYFKKLPNSSRDKRPLMANACGDVRRAFRSIFLSTELMASKPKLAPLLDKTDRGVVENFKVDIACWSILGWSYKVAKSIWVSNGCEALYNAFPNRLVSVGFETFKFRASRIWPNRKAIMLLGTLQSSLSGQFVGRRRTVLNDDDADEPEVDPEEELVGNSSSERNNSSSNFALFKLERFIMQQNFRPKIKRKFIECPLEKSLRKLLKVIAPLNK